MQLELDAHLLSLDALAAAAGFGGRSADTGIVVQNADGEIAGASAQAERILGVSFDQMRGRTSKDPRWAAVDESGRPVPGAQHPAVRALETGRTIRGAVMGVHRPGSEAPGHHVWLDVTAVPLRRPAEIRPWAVVVAFRPIAGDRLQELQLRDSERVHRMIAEHSSDMVAWQLLADFRFLWVSPASRALLGVDPDALVGIRGVDLVHPEDRSALQHWQAVADRAEGLTVRMLHADGVYRWIETTAHVLPDRDGPAQVITTHRDVTDRVVAERARDTAVRFLELAMKHATIGVALRTVDGILARVNPAMCTMLGRDADALIGHDLREFAAGPNSEADRGLAAVVAGDLPHHEIEWQFRKPDGTVLWCTRTVVALPSESGVVEHLLVQLQDITARRASAEQLERAASTDALTGLPNRVVLEERLNRALAAAQRSGNGVGVLFIDLDDFKWINDTLGHDIGDDLLREVGRRLASCVRRTDTIVRLGGDEFVAVRENLCDADQLDDLTARIRALFDEPFLVADRPLYVTASIGATTGFDVTARELLSRADDAMYRIKRRRRGHSASSRESLRRALGSTFRRLAANGGGRPRGR